MDRIANIVEASPEDEPKYIKRRSFGAPENPLARPSTPETGGGEHRMSSISGYRKQSRVPHVVGDFPVSVRGPDEVDLSPGTRYVVARFNFRDKDRAREGRLKIDQAGGRDIVGPRPETTEIDGKKLTYYTLDARFDIPDDVPLGQFIRDLQAKRASKVDGPYKEGERKRFQLVVQKRSGETETIFYRSREEAEEAKDEIERSIKANPVQGVVARRIKAGQSTIRARGMNPGQYYSDRRTQMRKHAGMIRDLGVDRARQEIARDLGIDDSTMRIQHDFWRGHLKAHDAEERIKRDKAEKKAQLDDYINSLLSMTAKQAQTDREMDRLKPDFEGSMHGQVHRVSGPLQFYRTKYIDRKTGEEKKKSGWRQAKRDLEWMWFKWDQPRKVPKIDKKTGEPVINPKTGKPEMETRHGEWLTPVEFSNRERGVRPVIAHRGEDRPDLPSAADLRAKRDRDVPDDRPTAVSPTRRRVTPDDPAYAEQYMKVLNAVGKYYLQSPLTKDLGEAIMGVLRTTRSKGSPTVQSLTRLSDAVEELRAELETGGEGMTPRGRELVMHAIDAGYRLLSQPPPVADEHEDDVGEFDLDADRNRGKSIGQQAASQLGFARPSNDPKSVVRRPPGRSGRRMYVATAPGLPSKLVQRIPFEYRKKRVDDFDVYDLWGDRGISSFARLVGEPPQDVAWRALQKKLGTDPLSSDRSGKVAGTGFVTPTGAQKSPGAIRSTGGGDTKGQDEPSHDTPWRALARMFNRPPERFDPRTLPRVKKKSSEKEETDEG